MPLNSESCCVAICGCEPSNRYTPRASREGRRSAAAAALLAGLLLTVAGCQGGDDPLSADVAPPARPQASASRDAADGDTADGDTVVPQPARPAGEQDLQPSRVEGAVDNADRQVAAGRDGQSVPDATSDDPVPAEVSARLPDVAPAAEPALPTADGVSVIADLAAESGSTERAATALDSPAFDPLTLEQQLAGLQIPPPWLEAVTTGYDTSKPWKEARLEIRRLLGLNQPAAHREALKLTWIYLQKDDIGDGHEYPMYTFLGGQPLWSVRAHEQYLQKPHEELPAHAYISLASLYVQFGAFEKGKACLETALADLPSPPWQVMRKADLMAALGDLHAAWGKTAEAKHNYAQAAELYLAAKPPYGGHLLPRRAADVQAKLDLLTFRSLQDTRLTDGRYQDRSLGYAGDIGVTVMIQDGRIADIRLKHEEKIDQNACVLIPQRIIQQQSLEVDGVSGATITKNAIVSAVYRCLKQAGLQ